MNMTFFNMAEPLAALFWTAKTCKETAPGDLPAPHPASGARAQRQGRSPRAAHRRCLTAARRSGRARRRRSAAGRAPPRSARRARAGKRVGRPPVSLVAAREGVVQQHPALIDRVEERREQRAPQVMVTITAPNRRSDRGQGAPSRSASTSSSCGPRRSSRPLTSRSTAVTGWPRARNHRARRPRPQARSRIAAPGLTNGAKRVIQREGSVHMHRGVPALPRRPFWRARATGPRGRGRYRRRRLAAHFLTLRLPILSFCHALLAPAEANYRPGPARGPEWCSWSPHPEEPVRDRLR